MNRSSHSSRRQVPKLPDDMERPTSARHPTRVALSLRKLGAAPHTRENGRDEVYNHHCLRLACRDHGAAPPSASASLLQQLSWRPDRGHGSRVASSDDINRDYEIRIFSSHTVGIIQQSAPKHGIRTIVTAICVSTSARTGFNVSSTFGLAAPPCIPLRKRNRAAEPLTPSLQRQARRGGPHKSP